MPTTGLWSHWPVEDRHQEKLWLLRGILLEICRGFNLMSFTTRAKA